MRPTPKDDRHDAGPGNRPGVPLRQLLWRSYVRTALIPLLVIELGFLATYWVSATMVYDRNVEAVSDLSRQYFQDLAHREAATISTRLEAVASHTRVFARQSLSALEGNYEPPASERARYAMTSDGVLYTTADNGFIASIYSNRTQIGPDEIAKVWRLSALDPLMKSIVESNDTISSVYFNTFDSYNRIYPYFNVLEQYPHDIDIPSYNFYYEADAEHNPERRDVWTDAYIDPAGHGWMVSSIAPVWRGDKLEGVAGIDVTLETLIESLLNLDLPWGGYAVLIDENGGIIALPPSGEEDFGLKELTSHHYAEAIQSDTFKPDTFNVFMREDTQPLAEAMRNASEGNVELQLNGERLASFDTVPQTGWKLVIIAPTDRIFADATSLNNQLRTVGYAMLAVLLAFYLLFFSFLLVRARQMSDKIASPLTEIADLIDHIGQRDNDPRFDGSDVEELDKLGHQLVATERRLIEAEDESREQGRIAQEALAQVREANDEMVRFTRQISHQIRTPLSIIDGTAQIVQRKADSIEPEELRKRASRLRGTVRKIADLLASMVERFDALSGGMAPEDIERTEDLPGRMAAIAQELVPGERLELSVAADFPAAIQGASALLAVTRDVLESAMRNALPASPIKVALTAENQRATMTIHYRKAVSEPAQLPRPDPAMQEALSRAGEAPDLGRQLARQSFQQGKGSVTAALKQDEETITVSMPMQRIEQTIDA